MFDGQGTRPWEPDDERHPLNAYGEAKYAGELAIEKYVEKFFTVRIAWVFGVNGKNFIKTMLRIGEQNLSLIHILHRFTRAMTGATSLAETAEARR